MHRLPLKRSPLPRGLRGKVSSARPVVQKPLYLPATREEDSFSGLIELWSEYAAELPEEAPMLRLTILKAHGLSEKRPFKLLREDPVDLPRGTPSRSVSIQMPAFKVNTKTVVGLVRRQFGKVCAAVQEVRLAESPSRGINLCRDYLRREREAFNKRYYPSSVYKTSVRASMATSSRPKVLSSSFSKSLGTSPVCSQSVSTPQPATSLSGRSVLSKVCSVSKTAVTHDSADARRHHHASRQICRLSIPVVVFGVVRARLRLHWRKPGANRPEDEAVFGVRKGQG